MTDNRELNNTLHCWTSQKRLMNYSWTIHSFTIWKEIPGLYWKQDEWWGGAKMNGIHGEVLMWGFLAPTQLSALFWHCCCSSRIGVAKEEEVRMNRMKRSEQTLGDWMFTSSMFVAVLWLKSPDPRGQLPHGHILAISPLQRRFRYQICQEFNVQNLQFNVVNDYMRYKKIQHHQICRIQICALFALFCKRLIFPVWLV